jgi:hypothetical protein
MQTFQNGEVGLTVELALVGTCCQNHTTYCSEPIWRGVPESFDALPLDLQHIINPEDYHVWAERINASVEAEKRYLSPGRIAGWVFGSLFCPLTCGLSYWCCLLTDCGFVDTSLQRMTRIIRETLPPSVQKQGRVYNIDVQRISQINSGNAWHRDRSVLITFKYVQTVPGVAPEVMNYAQVHCPHCNTPGAAGKFCIRGCGRLPQP